MRQKFTLFLPLGAQALMIVAACSVAACGPTSQPSDANATRGSIGTADAANDQSEKTVTAVEEIDYSKHGLTRTIPWRDEYVSCVVFSPTGKQLVTGSWGRVAFWNTSTWQKDHEFAPQYRLIQSIEYASDSKTMLTAGSDGTVKVWNAEQLDEPLLVMDGYETYWPNDAKFSPDAKSIAISSSNLIDLRDSATGKTIWQARDGDDVYFGELSFSPDGKYLAVACEANTHYVSIRDTRTGRQAAKLSGHPSKVTTVQYNQDGTLIASGSVDETVRIWNASSHESINVLKGHSNFIRQVRFSPDGRHLASTSYDRSIRVWNVESGKQVAVMVGSEDGVMDLAFSPDGKLIASGGIDNAVRIWGAPN